MEKLSVLIPSYNNAKTIGKAIASVLLQKACDFEVIVSDDCSTDNTVSVIKEMYDRKISLREHKENIGCGENLNRLVEYAKNDVLYFLCGDDVLIDPFALARISLLFEHRKLGVVSRPYYWFIDAISCPVRVRPISFRRCEYEIVQSFDQISGIALRKSKMRNKFSNTPFIEMASVAYPMACHNQTIMLSSYPVAIRIGDNGASKPSAFTTSPLASWHTVIGKNRNLTGRFARNDVGLVQIKMWGTTSQLVREIRLMLRYYPLNAVRIKFWFFALGTLLMPKKALRRLVRWYREIPK